MAWEFRVEALKENTFLVKGSVEEMCAYGAGSLCQPRGLNHEPAELEAQNAAF